MIYQGLARYDYNNFIQYLYLLAAIVELCSDISKLTYSSVVTRNVAMSVEAMRYLDLEQGMIVRAQCIHADPLPVYGIILTVSEKEVTIESKL